MSPDILIVRDNEGYRVLHGHLHLVNTLSMTEEVLVEVQGEGPVRIVKKHGKIFVSKGNQRMPLLAN
jgi:hypothetical protein